MLFGQYNSPQTYKTFLTHPIWNTAFAWIQANAHTLQDGEHAIQGRDMYANTQSMTTVPMSDGFYEVHREYIDIHFCLSGGEAIAYAPLGDLEEKELNTEKDYQLFSPTKIYSLCILQPNFFAIFFPEELHMPKLNNGINQEVKKVVIKIHKDLLL